MWKMYGKLLQRKGSQSFLRMQDITLWSSAVSPRTYPVRPSLSVVCVFRESKQAECRLWKALSLPSSKKSVFILFVAAMEMSVVGWDSLPVEIAEIILGEIIAGKNPVIPLHFVCKQWHTLLPPPLSKGVAGFCSSVG